jgi:tRNA(Ser,Leu) C12 N-acetylase TAN1
MDFAAPCAPPSSGEAERSPYHNVLVMAVEDPLALLEAVEQKTREVPALYDAISRVAPAMNTFDFHSVEEFKESTRSLLMEWLAHLEGRSFHVRLHTRGFKSHFSAPDAERLFDDGLLDALKAEGRPGSVTFADPDAVIAIDTIDEHAGISLWERKDLSRYRPLRPD